MVIETKYNIGDEVWFNPECPIQGVIIEFRKTEKEELYGILWLGRSFSFIPECWIALTKEELLKSFEI